MHVIGVGLNTRSHAAEVATWRGTNREVPEYPRLFLRSPVSQVGHGGALWVPRVSKRLDYEGELAVVIGRYARYLTSTNALDAVAGYSCYNDGSVRDYQSHTNQSTAGKSFPHTGGFGPWLITRDEAPPLDALHLCTTVNGDLRQEMRADDLIFTMPALLVYVSEAMALQPGRRDRHRIPCGERRDPASVAPGGRSGRGRHRGHRSPGQSRRGRTRGHVQVTAAPEATGVRPCGTPAAPDLPAGALGDRGRPVARPRRLPR